MIFEDSSSKFGSKIEKIQSRLKVSISLENVQSRLKCSIPALQNPPPPPQKKVGVWWVARLKFSISLEDFKILNFFNLWALRLVRTSSLIRG